MGIKLREKVNAEVEAGLRVKVRGRCSVSVGPIVRFSLRTCIRFMIRFMIRFRFRFRFRVRISFWASSGILGWFCFLDWSLGRCRTRIWVEETVRGKGNCKDKIKSNFNGRVGAGLGLGFCWGRGIGNIRGNGKFRGKGHSEGKLTSKG